MEQRVSLITLGVADLGRARAFYEGLGWTTGAGPEDDVVFFQTPGCILALWDRARLAADSAVEDPGGWGGITLAHNVRSPDEVDAVLDQAAAAGGKVTRPGTETFWGGYSASSRTRRAIRGRSRTTRTGLSTTTGRYHSRPLQTGARSDISRVRRPGSLHHASVMRAGSPPT